MTRKLLTVALVVFVSSLNVLPVQARSDAHIQSEQHLSEIKSKVAKRGIGPKAKVKVTQLDGTKSKGYISEAGADAFTVTDTKTGKSVAIQYSQVKQVKSDGLSTGAKIALGVGIGVVAFVVIIGVVNSALDDGR